MRVLKVEPGKYEKAVILLKQRCEFIKIPSSNGKFFFTGLKMYPDVWISWPDNLTDEELEKYIRIYGEPMGIYV
jgi:hypothetical protein